MASSLISLSGLTITLNLSFNSILLSFIFTAAIDKISSTFGFKPVVSVSNATYSFSGGSSNRKL